MPPHTIDRWDDATGEMHVPFGELSDAEIETGYGPNFLGYFRHAGVMVARILRGADPAETPIDRPTKFEFVLNLKTAAVLGIVIPPATLLRADEVIE